MEKNSMKKLTIGFSIFLFMCGMVWYYLFHEMTLPVKLEAKYAVKKSSLPFFSIVIK
jgi:hypothetical protein